MTLALSIIFFILSAILLLISNKRIKRATKILDEVDTLLDQIDLDGQVLVQKKWIKLLIEHAETFEEKAEKYEYSGGINDRIHQEAIALMGYAKSAKYIK